MFQDKLLRTLWTQDDPEVIMNCLEPEDSPEPRTDSGCEMDLRLMALMDEFAKRWGVIEISDH